MYNIVVEYQIDGTRHKDIVATANTLMLANYLWGKIVDRPDVAIPLQSVFINTYITKD